MLKQIKVAWQYLLPKRFLTQLLGWLAERKAGFLTQLLIKIFVRYYQINLREALQPEIAQYATFNDFFTRHLCPKARPIVKDKRWLAHPVDGTVSQIGVIQQGQLLQAKGHHYALEDLLVGSEKWVKTFTEGQFATFYLAPKDYHRVHMPCDGLLREMIHIPGNFFSVNEHSVAAIPHLFVQNERVICIFDTAFGTLAQILVGAALVGTISVAWQGQITALQKEPTCWSYPADGPKRVQLKKGMEMGYFKLGSTVINLFPPQSVIFSKHLHCHTMVKMGAQYAKMVDNSSHDDPQSSDKI